MEMKFQHMKMGNAEGDKKVCVRGYGPPRCQLYVINNGMRMIRRKGGIGQFTWKPFIPL